jgi:uncharacterized protein YgiM (DUF1202 family)
LANCANCGTPLKDGAKFCPACGTKTEPTEAQAVSVPAQTAAATAFISVSPARWLPPGAKTTAAFEAERKSKSAAAEKDDSIDEKSSAAPANAGRKAAAGRTGSAAAPKKKKHPFIAVIIIIVIAYFVLNFLGRVFGSGEKRTETPAAEVPVLKASVTANSANFREGPSTDTKVLKALKKGDVLTVTGEAANGWIPAEHDGVKGYISADLVSIE